MRTFEFSRKGLNEALAHKDYIGIAKEKLEEHPEVFVLALTAAVIAAATIVSPGASAIAYKSGAIDISEIAFKYMNYGGF